MDSAPGTPESYVSFRTSFAYPVISVLRARIGCVRGGTPDPVRLNAGPGQGGLRSGRSLAERAPGSRAAPGPRWTEWRSTGAGSQIRSGSLRVLPGGSPYSSAGRPAGPRRRAARKGQSGKTEDTGQAPVRPPETICPDEAASGSTPKPVTTQGRPRRDSEAGTGDGRLRSCRSTSR